MLEHMSLDQWHKLPGNTPKKPKKAGHIAEKAVLKACLQWLKAHGIPAWRRNTGSYEVSDKHGNPRYIAYGFPGAADIEGILPFPLHSRGGRHLEIECKSSDGHQSEKQKAFQRMVEQAGGIYILARSTDALAVLLKPPSE